MIGMIQIQVELEKRDTKTVRTDMTKEEHGRHSRYMDSHDSKRSRHDDDSHYHALV
jgi:serine/arginine repetitive matrix protein 2